MVRVMVRVLSISNFQPKILNLNQKQGGVGMIYKRLTHSNIIFCKFCV